jgi:hypothetical protein
MKKAWFSGALAVVLTHLVLFGLIVAATRLDGLMPLIVQMLLVQLSVAGLGAFIIARRSPGWRLPLALTMAPLSAALGTVSNLLLALFAIRVDLSGFYNDAGLFLVLLGFEAPAALLGGLLGLWRGKRREKDDVPAAAAPITAVDNLPEMTITSATANEDLPQIRSD